MSNIAQEYAAALRTAGGSLEQLTESAAELTAHEALWEALCIPAVEAHEKTAVLARLPEFPRGDTLRAFYVLLAKNGRFALLPDIVVAYQQLERREQGEGLCVLRCARDPGDDTLGPLARFLCKQHGYQSLTFDIVVDPEVLGGFVLEIDGITYDKSVRGQLHALAQRLQKG